MQNFIKLSILLAMLLSLVSPTLAQIDDDWTTFTSEDGKFSFQYPATWEIVENPTGNNLAEKIYVAIDARDADGNYIFFGEGTVVNASKTNPSPFQGPRLSDSVWAVVDYISYDERYYDYELREGSDDIQVREVEGQPALAYVCACGEGYRTYYFAVALGNGNYFTLKTLAIYDQDIVAVRDTIIEFMLTSAYDQQTVYTDLVFPEPAIEEAPILWRISSEQYFAIRGSAIDSEDNIYAFYYFVEPEPKRALVVLDANGEVVRIVSHPEMGGNDTAIGQDGSIWVTDGSIHHFTSNGEFIETITHSSAGWEVVVDISGFSDIEIDAQNNLIALNTSGTASIAIFSPEGELLNSFEVPFASHPNGYYDWLAVDDGEMPSINITADQIIYVHSPYNNIVRAYDMDGNELATDLIIELVNSFPMHDETDHYLHDEGIQFFYYGADGLFYVIGSARDNDKPYGVYIYDETGTQLGFVEAGAIEFEGTLTSQFFTLSDGSVVTIHHNDIVRRDSVH